MKTHIAVSAITALQIIFSLILFSLAPFICFKFLHRIISAVLVLGSQISCEQVCLLFKTTYLGTAHKHCEKIDSLLGGLGIWQVFLKPVWHLSHTEVIFSNSINYSVCLLTVQQHLNYRKVIRPLFILHKKRKKPKPGNTSGVKTNTSDL